MNEGGKIRIDGRKVGNQERTYIIAEVGQNYEGNIEKAKKMIDKAADAGADAWKTQTYIAEADMSRKEMEKIGMGNVYENLKDRELSYEEHKELKRYCEKKGITFLSTPFSAKAITDFLQQLDIVAYKIGSGHSADRNMLEKLKKNGKSVIASTGMKEQKQVDKIHSYLQKNGIDHSLLYCISEYPVDSSEYNLGTIEKWKQKYGVPVGFSDHAPNNEAAKIAIAMGADIVEKHVTFEGNEGPDSSVSINFDQLEELVEWSERVHKMSDSGLRITENEEDIKSWGETSLTTTEKVQEGEKFTEDNLTTKRPSVGISSWKYPDIIGKKANKDIQADQVLKKEDIR